MALGIRRSHECQEASTRGRSGPARCAEVRRWLNPRDPRTQPDALRTPRRTAWADANRGGQPTDSFLEGPVFDDAGHLYVTDIPFGRELVTSARERHFMERSQGSLALFPGEPDVGARLTGGAAFFRYSLAVMNGEPFDERTGTREWNASKDFIGRLGVDVRPSAKVRVAGGVSALRGMGFHPGTDATKNLLQWQDLNENGALDSGETVAIPGTENPAHMAENIEAASPWWLSDAMAFPFGTSWWATITLRSRWVPSPFGPSSLRLAMSRTSSPLFS